MSPPTLEDLGLAGNNGLATVFGLTAFLATGAAFDLDAAAAAGFGGYKHCCQLITYQNI